MHSPFLQGSRLLRGGTEHERRIREHFGGQLINGTRRDDPDTTFILFTNRSGSNLLAEFLWSTEKFNRAGEFLNWQMVVNQSKRRRYATFADYLIAKSADAVDGRYAVKASIHQYAFLEREGLLESLFPRRCILISERLDKIGQAISWLIASQTKAWTSRQKSEVAPQSVEYDRNTIEKFLKGVQNAHRDMELYLNIRREPFCRVVYEELVDMTDLTMARVTRFVGCPDVAIDASRVRLSKQANEINETFRSRFLSETPGIREILKR